MKFSKTLAAILSALTFFASAAFAVEVNRNELSAYDDSVITFENYMGPHSRIDTLEAINAIGTGLGNYIHSRIMSPATTSNGKYTVIHAIDLNNKDGLDADILLIEKSATVDHITNLRRIIASYLSAAYGYEYKDAMTLATFVTVYNAVYRNDLDYYSSKYKSVVMRYLHKNTCGLSIKWNEWAGRSEIVIPLYDLNGGISTIDTSTISDKQVISSIREEDDMGIDERKNLADIKEKESKAASDKAKDAAKEAAIQNRELEQQKLTEAKAQKESKEASRDALQADKKAEAARNDADANPDDKEKQALAEKLEAEAAEKDRIAEEKKEKADEEARKLAEQQEKTDEARGKASEQQDFSDKKQKEAVSDRKEIAQDQKFLVELKQIDDINPNAIIGLQMVDAKNNLCAMVKMDSATGEVIKTSSVKVIRGRTIIPVYKPMDGAVADENGYIEADPATLKYMAICGENSGNQAVRLCLLDPKKMLLTDQTNENVAEDSVLVQSGNGFYCTIKSGTGYVVARYDSQLNLLMKSNVNVLPSTPIVVTDKGIMVTSSDMMPVVLGLEDMKQVSGPKAEVVEK